MKKLSILLLCSLFVVGCANMNKPPRVYWGNYSDTLYQLKKEPSEITLAAHKAELEQIISKSGEWNILPPPGACAELGKIYLENGNSARATELLNQEVQNYPESKTLVSLLLKNIEQGS